MILQGVLYSRDLFSYDQEVENLDVQELAKFVNSALQAIKTKDGIEMTRVYVNRIHESKQDQVTCVFEGSIKI